MDMSPSLQMNLDWAAWWSSCAVYQATDNHLCPYNCHSRAIAKSCPCCRPDPSRHSTLFSCTSFPLFRSGHDSFFRLLEPSRICHRPPLRVGILHPGPIDRSTGTGRDPRTYGIQHSADVYWRFLVYTELKSSQIRIATPPTTLHPAVQW